MSLDLRSQETIDVLNAQSEYMEMERNMNDETVPEAQTQSVTQPEKHKVFFLTDAGNEIHNDERRNSLEEAIKVCLEGVFRNAALAGNSKACSKEIQTRQGLYKKKKLVSVDSTFWDTYSSNVEDLEDVFNPSDSEEEELELEEEELELELEDSDTQDSTSDLDDNDPELQLKDPNGDFMVYPSRNKTLKRLTGGLAERLKLSTIELISKENARMCLGEERFQLLMDEKPIEHLFIFDSKRRLSIFWKTGKLLAEYLLDEAASGRLIDAAGWIRDQDFHLLCWAFAVCDLISICRVLHGLDEDFQPLSPMYLCQNVRPDLFGREIGPDDMHKCYGCGHIDALFYIQKHGIPRESPDEKNKFDCRTRCDNVGTKYHIKSIFQYPTLEKAMLRLKTHPVIAGLICYEGSYK